MRADGGGTIKRRGILAAAGAVVAGLAMKQVSQPVAAAPTAMVTETPNMEAATTSLVANPGTYAADGAFVVDASGVLGIVNGATVRAGSLGYGGGVGVVAYGGQTSAGLEAHGGVTPTSAFSPGPGVVGLAGRIAAATGNVYNCGVYGEAKSGTSPTYGIGVHGRVQVEPGFGNAVVPATGVFGETDAPHGVGVQGQAAGVGVYGLSNGSYGIVGITTAGGPFSGITGGAQENGAAAFAGGTSNPAAYAAYFSGRTVVQGDFTVVSGQKNAAVKHTDGSYRLLHCVESPEPWFEDFGKATLADGVARVTLDPDFAAVVDVSNYHVFLTTYGDGGNGLTVAETRPDGFVVRERGGGSGSNTFSWRLVARRKDLGKVQRLAKFTLPDIKIPGVSDLPKPPPTAPTPEKPRDAAPPAPAPSPRTTGQPSATAAPAMVTQPTTAPIVASPQTAPPRRP